MVQHVKFETMIKLLRDSLLQGSSSSGFSKHQERFSKCEASDNLTIIEYVTSLT